MKFLGCWASNDKTKRSTAPQRWPSHFKPHAANFQTPSLHARPPMYPPTASLLQYHQVHQFPSLQNQTQSMSPYGCPNPEFVHQWPVMPNPSSHTISSNLHPQEEVTHEQEKVDAVVSYAHMLHKLMPTGANQHQPVQSQPQNDKRYPHYPFKTTARPHMTPMFHTMVESMPDVGQLRRNDLVESMRTDVVDFPTCGRTEAEWAQLEAAGMILMTSSNSQVSDEQPSEEELSEQYDEYEKAESSETPSEKQISEKIRRGEYYTDDISRYSEDENNETIACDEDVIHLTDKLIESKVSDSQDLYYTSKSAVRPQENENLLFSSSHGFLEKDNFMKSSTEDNFMKSSIEDIHIPSDYIEVNDQQQIDTMTVSSSAAMITSSSGCFVQPFDCHEDDPLLEFHTPAGGILNLQITSNSLDGLLSHRRLKRSETTNSINSEASRFTNCRSRTAEACSTPKSPEVVSQKTQNVPKFDALKTRQSLSRDFPPPLTTTRGRERSRHKEAGDLAVDEALRKVKPNFVCKKKLPNHYELQLSNGRIWNLRLESTDGEFMGYIDEKCVNDGKVMKLEKLFQKINRQGKEN